jgi:hypothetical protein
MPPAVIWPLVQTADMDSDVTKVTVLLTVKMPSPSRRPEVINTSVYLFFAIIKKLSP